MVFAFLVSSMSKIKKSKYKVSRSLVVNIWGRAKDAVAVKNYCPGQHGRATMRKPSDYAMQLRAKQHLRTYHNMTEKQFRRFFFLALRRRGNTAEDLIGLLNSRLDAVVFRASFANTIFAASQLVNHGHVLVNGKKVDIRSYCLKPGDIVSLSVRACQFPFVARAIEDKERNIPPHLQVDHAKHQVIFSDLPSLVEAQYESAVQPHLVVEHYSSR